MDLIASCPFRSLMAVFFAVPVGVIAAIFCGEISARLLRRGWRAAPH